MSEMREIARRWAADCLTAEELAELSQENRAAILADQELVWRRRTGNVPTNPQARTNADGSRVIPYVMSVEKGVGYFKDAIIQSGWEFEEFDQRGRPFLWAHNLHEQKPWLGRMSNLDKAGKVGRAAALTGDAEFTPLGMNEFNDGIHAMVAGGFMPGGSVGFRVLESRLPKTETEKKKLGCEDNSSVFVRCSLVEFSSVPIGMDPDANAQAYEQLEDHLRAGVAGGTYRQAVADEIRGLVFGTSRKASVTVPEMPFRLEVDGASVRVEPLTATSGTGAAGLAIDADGSVTVTSYGRALAPAAPARRGVPEIQALLVPRARFELDEAKALVRDLGYRAVHVTEQDGTWRFEQFATERGTNAQPITLDRARGIQAVTAEVVRSEDMDASEKRLQALEDRVADLEDQNEQLREIVELFVRGDETDALDTGAEGDTDTEAESGDELEAEGEDEDESADADGEDDMGERGAFGLDVYRALLGEDANDASDEEVLAAVAGDPSGSNED